MNNSLAIQQRRALAGDLDFMWQTFRDTMKDYIEAARGQWDETREHSQFHKQLDTRNTWIILKGEERVGFIMAPIIDGAQHIHTICITSEHQRKGIGGFIINEKVRAAQAAGLPVYLSVFKANPAYAMYERLGFVQYQESQHHYLLRLLKSEPSG